jgi:hypothetical protein
MYRLLVLCVSPHRTYLHHLVVSSFPLRCTASHSRLTLCAPCIRFVPTISYTLHSILYTYTLHLYSALYTYTYY